MMDGLKERSHVQWYSIKNHHIEKTQNLVFEELDRTNRYKKICHLERNTQINTFENRVSRVSRASSVLVESLKCLTKNQNRMTNTCEFTVILVPVLPELQLI